MKRWLAAIAVAVGLLAGSLMSAQPASAGGGSSYLAPDTCTNLWINDHLDWWGFNIASVHFEVDDACNVFNLYGYYVFVPPYPYAWRTHGNNPIFYLWCGYSGLDQGWIYGNPFDWGASDTANFVATGFGAVGAACPPPLETKDGVGIWIYAGGYGPWNPPLVLNTSQNWSAPL